MTKILLTITILFIGWMALSQGIVSTVVDTIATKFTDDLIFDSNGNLYGSDYDSDVIYKRTPSGVITVFANGMNTPNGMAFDSGGNMFVCDNFGNAIFKISPTGIFLDTFPVNQPAGIIKDAMSDTMIFTTYTTNSIQKLAPDGSFTPFHAGPPLAGPVGLEYCQGELYAANYFNRAIYRVESDTLIFITQIPGVGSIGFMTVVGNYLMLAAFNSNKIYTINPITQIFSLYSGGATGYLDGPVTTALFAAPNGIVANASGDTLYISEYYSGRLRMITRFTVENQVISSSPGIQLYPNPVSDRLSLTVNPADLPYSVRIIDLTGKVVHQLSDITEITMELDLSEFNTGTYFLEINSANSEMILERIIKID